MDTKPVFHVGDLVQNNSGDINKDKKYGIVVEIGHKDFALLNKKNWVKVHWPDYGAFWTSVHSIDLISRAGEEE